MLSAEDLAAVKVAIEICNFPEIKKEILCTPGSEYDINKGIVPSHNKRLWDEIVEKKATVILEKVGLVKLLQERVIGIVLLAGMRILTWAEYQESTFGISLEYSANFLNSSFFTQQGIIDNKKAAEELIKDESLSTKEKYKLACLYCFEDRIPVLYRQMTKEEKKKFYDPRWSGYIKQPELVKFWSYYLMGEVDKLKGEKTLDQYRLEKAVESGSKAAVQYCLEKTKLIRNKYALVEAAVEAVKFSSRGNWCFRGRPRGLWVPNDFSVDILRFLLMKMDKDQQIEFLKQDITGAKLKRESDEEGSDEEDEERSIVPEFLLNWPHQDYFMKTAGVMWEFLPERDYAVLLLRICDKIGPRSEGSLNYGEEKSYDYRVLLKEFWHQSPERYKRYVFSNNVVEYVIIKTKAGVRLVIELLTLTNFTGRDGKNIQLILSSATDKEKESLISSEEWRHFCIRQMSKEKWEMLDRVVLNCFLSKEEENKFKKELCFTEGAQRTCIRFIRKAKWNAAETFIKWSSLPEVEIKKLKKEMIYSELGRMACVDLFSDDNELEPVDQFIRWCVSSEEDLTAFRKELVFSDVGTRLCAHLVKNNQLELVSEFIRFCLSSGTLVKELRKKVAYGFGGEIFSELISQEDLERIYDNEGRLISCKFVKFKGSKWEQVVKFLTWCFSSEEDICDFKKNVLLKEFGREIHFNLINFCRWDEIETFFAWLELSSEEIKQLKKDTLFRYDAAREMFRELMYSEEDDEEYAVYGSKQEAIELLLRWYLTDEETVLEFKDEFKRQYRDITEEDEAVIKNFDLMIDQRLKDLDEERKGVKRKSEAFLSSKRICNVELEMNVQMN